MLSEIHLSIHPSVDTFVHSSVNNNNNNNNSQICKAPYAKLQRRLFVQVHPFVQ